jgi:hypothetical protein
LGSLQVNDTTREALKSAMARAAYEAAEAMCPGDDRWDAWDDMDRLQEIAEPEDEGVKVYFNPFAFTIEENNAFIAAGYEPIPMRIPTARALLSPSEDAPASSPGGQSNG